MDMAMKRKRKLSASFDILHEILSYTPEHQHL